MRRGKRFAFTLVELLVVITIISLLAGLLLPVLENANEAAINIVCRNQQKQLYLFFIDYVGEYNGLVPGGHFGINQGPTGYSAWPKADRTNWRSFLWVAYHDESSMVHDFATGFLDEDVGPSLLHCPKSMVTYIETRAISKCHAHGNSNVYSNALFGNETGDADAHKCNWYYDPQPTGGRQCSVYGHHALASRLTPKGCLILDGWIHPTYPYRILLGSQPFPSSHGEVPHNGTGNALMGDGHVTGYTADEELFYRTLDPLAVEFYWWYTL